MVEWMGEKLPGLSGDVRSLYPGGMELDEVGASLGSGGVGGAGVLLAEETVLSIDDPTLEAEILFEGIPPDDSGGRIPTE